MRRPESKDRHARRAVRVAVAFIVACSGSGDGRDTGPNATPGAHPGDGSGNGGGGDGHGANGTGGGGDGNGNGNENGGHGGGDHGERDPDGRDPDPGPGGGAPSRDPFTTFHADVGGGAGFDRLGVVEALFDASSDKVLLVGVDASRRPGLRRCEPDNSGCIARVLDAGRGVDSGASLVAAIDARGGKLLVVARDTAWVDPTHPAFQAPARLALFRCDLDGSACARVDISAGMQDVSHGWPAWTAVDTETQKLLVTGCADHGNGRGPTLVRCNLDGTACTRRSIAPGASDVCGNGFVLDEARRRLSFTTIDPNAAGPSLGAEPSTLAIVQCSADGAGCASRQVDAADLVAPRDRKGGVGTQLVVDTQNQKLLVVVHDSEGPRGETVFSLLRCELDGTACTKRVLPRSIGSAMFEAQASGAQLLVSSAGGRGAALLSCSLDGTACTRTELNVDQPRFPFPFSGTARLAFDPARNAAFVTSGFGLGGSPPRMALFRQTPGVAPDRHEINAGLGVMRFARSATFDEAGGQLLIVSDVPGTGSVVTRCSTDGSSCAVTPVPRIGRVLGVAGDSVVMVGRAAAGGEQAPPDLVVCARDLTGCSRSALPRGATLLDAAGRRVVVLRPLPETSRPDASAGVVTCPLDASPCSERVSIPAREVRASTIDREAGQLVLVGDRRLLRCGLDGSSCAVEHDVSDHLIGGSRPLLIADAASTILSSDLERLVVTRCPAGGDATCTSNPIALGPGSHYLHAFSAAVDEASGKLVVVTDDRARLRKPTLLYCDPDGSACTEHDISAGFSALSGKYPSAFIEPSSRRLLTITESEPRLSRASLFSVALP
jgi:hypothetical protein